MIIRENQLKEIEYLKEAQKLLSNVHEALIKAHDHLSNRVSEKNKEVKKLYEIVLKEESK